MRTVRALWGKIRRRLSQSHRLPPDFVEAAYLQANPDVAHAVREGVVRSGAKHWLASGAEEGRRLKSDDGPGLPPEFDERAYLVANPDVRVAVQDGLFPSGAAHWLTVGRKDGRAYTTHQGTEKPTLPNDRREALIDAEAALTRHDLRSGLDVRLDGFDGSAYARNNPDVVASVGEDSGRLLQHWKSEGFIDGRTPYGYPPYAERKFGPEYWNKRNGISFFGLLDADTGLGTSARGYLTALEKSGVPVAAYNVVDRQGRYQIPQWSFEGDLGKSDKVNIFHINADMTHRFFLDGRMKMLDNSYNIAIWFWELLDFPRDWFSAFGAFDEIWVASEYVRRAVASVAPIPVTKIPTVVSQIAAETRLSRDHFDIPSDVFVFACIFDVGSVIERKNPRAAIVAFKQAFAKRADVLLLLKHHGSHHYPASLDELTLLAKSNRNIRFVDRNFTVQEAQDFMNAIDCLVSPHRVEGFGLNIAEAMLAGKPVIATGYSGNMEFTTAQNSYLIDYEQREIGQDYGPYSRHSLWAEPNIDDLTRLMLSVFLDRDMAVRKALAAQVDIANKNSVDAASVAIRARLDELRPFSLSPKFFTTWGRGLQARTEFFPARSVCFTVIVVVGKIEERRLRRCVSSVLKQTYPHWELIVHGDEGTHQDALSYIDELRGSDPRIKISMGIEYENQIASRNEALMLSSYNFVAWVDSWDELHPNTLSDLAVVVIRNPGVDLIYFEDCLTDRPIAPPPEHSRDSNNVDTVNDPRHFALARRALLLRMAARKSQPVLVNDDDLALRTSRDCTILHIAKPLGKSDDRII